MRRSFLAEIYWRNPLLTLCGWLHVALLLAAVVGYMTDDRMAMGVDPWLTPLKLMASIVIHVWTVAWFSKYVRRPRWLLSTVSIVIAAAMVIVSGCLILQAARGTVSYYDATTDFDTAILNTMLLMIGINMLMVLVMLLMFRKRGRLHPAYLWSVCAGILIFLGGGVASAVMGASDSIMAGTARREPSLLFFDWAGIAGACGVSHWLVLHAMQILPLTGYAISGSTAIQRTSARMLLLTLAVLLYVAVIFAACRQAVTGV